MALSGCPHCTEQKEKFGASFQYAPYVECGVKGQTSGKTQVCQDAGIQHYPTWQFPPTGERVERVFSLEELSDRTGCALAMNPRLQRLFSLVAILAVGGIVVSSVSLKHHYATSKTEFCDIGNTFNCDIVNRSEYSEILGMPVALIGMVGYARFWGLRQCIGSGGRLRR